MVDKKARFLIVDDMMVLRMQMKKFLSNLGYSDFTEAGDGEEALEKLMNANPPIDLVISDWSMPKMTGIYLLKSIRENEVFKDLPFYFVTSESEAEQLKKAEEFGANGFLKKPFVEEDIKKLLE